MATIVVTGAAGALGSVLCRHLVARGDRVAAIDMPRSEERLRALREELGEAILPLAVDVTSGEAWAEVRARIERELGPPEGAVLVAGGWRGGAPFHAEPDDAVWRAMVDTNLETAERSLRALLPGMVARRRGSVVVIGSRAVERPWTSAGAAAYAATKAAVVALAQAIAAEVIEHGVRVNAVLPSVIDTAANRGAMPDADPSRWVSPASLAGVIGFLLSDDARDVSGAAIPVYGRA
jgi:NAD(P)-dependent dehydrogenase (short-subunit alcohol dehydrogenase family)